MLSVIIPCYNEERFIGRLLACLEAQSLDKKYFEVIVVDNNSTDGTSKEVEIFKKQSELYIKVCKEPVKGVSKAKNTGAMRSSFSHLLFIDADNSFDSVFLDSICTDICQGSQVATIKTLSFEFHMIGSAVFWVLELIKKAIPRPFGKCHVSKDLLLAVGGYNESIELGENVEFLSRVKKFLNESDYRLNHINAPLNCSLRRFEKEGYCKVLLSWFIAYLGNWKLHYPTLDEI